MPPAILVPTNVILTKFINIPTESIIVAIIKLAFKESFILLNSPYNTARLVLVVDLAIEYDVTLIHIHGVSELAMGQILGQLEQIGSYQLLEVEGSELVPFL